MITFKNWIIESTGAGIGDFVTSRRKEFGRNSALDFRQTMGSSGRFWDENMPMFHRAASGAITGVGGAFQKTLAATGATPAAAAREFFPWESIDDKGSHYEYSLAGHIPEKIANDTAELAKYSKKAAEELKPELMKHPTIKKLIADGYNLGSYTHHVIYDKDGKPMWYIAMKFPKLPVHSTADAETGEHLPNPNTVINRV